MECKVFASSKVSLARFVNFHAEEDSACNDKTCTIVEVNEHVPQKFIAHQHDSIRNEFGWEGQDGTKMSTIRTQ